MIQEHPLPFILAFGQILAFLNIFLFVYAIAWISLLVTQQTTNRQGSLAFRVSPLVLGGSLLIVQLFNPMSRRSFQDPLAFYAIQFAEVTAVAFLARHLVRRHWRSVKLDIWSVFIALVVAVIGLQMLGYSLLDLFGPMGGVYRYD